MILRFPPNFNTWVSQKNYLHNEGQPGLSHACLAQVWSHKTKWWKTQWANLDLSDYSGRYPNVCLRLSLALDVHSRASALWKQHRVFQYCHNWPVQMINHLANFAQEPDHDTSAPQGGCCKGWSRLRGGGIPSIENHKKQCFAVSTIEVAKLRDRENWRFQSFEVPKLHLHNS